MGVAPPPGDALLVVPPFAHLTWPALGVHLLQAAARPRRVPVLYASLIYGARVGAPLYGALCNAPMDWLLGERLFARAASGHSGLTQGFLEEVARWNRGAEDPREYVDHLTDAAGVSTARVRPRYDIEALRRCEAEAVCLCEELGAALAGRYAAVGSTSTFEQTSASLGLLRALRQRDQAVLTLLGGANADGDLAEGLFALGGVDAVFSGEADHAFGAWLEALLSGGEPARGVVRCEPVHDLSALPGPDYTDYFEQLEATLPHLTAPTWLSYESSRGCWWGEKKQCTFCGLNGATLGFRAKPASVVLDDLSRLGAAHGVSRVHMGDCILPRAYLTELLPHLQQALPGAWLFYEARADLGAQEVAALVSAGVRFVQAGVESLSTPVLQRLRKGTTARRVLAFLRHARAAGLGVKWNLLAGVPGDLASEHEPLLALMPLVHHLAPPMMLGSVTLQRFSPLWRQPEAWGLTDIRPWPAYAEVFGPDAPLEGLATHFSARFASGSLEDADLMEALEEGVATWQRAWEGTPPVLEVRPHGAGWSLTDTRAVARVPWMPLTSDQARAVLTEVPLDAPGAAWARRQGYAVEADGRHEPLATARARYLTSTSIGSGPATTSKKTPSTM